MMGRRLCPVYSSILGGNEKVWCDEGKGHLGETGGRARLLASNLNQSISQLNIIGLLLCASTYGSEQNIWYFCSSGGNSLGGKNSSSSSNNSNNSNS